VVAAIAVDERLELVAVDGLLAGDEIWLGGGQVDDDDLHEAFALAELPQVGPDAVHDGAQPVAAGGPLVRDGSTIELPHVGEDGARVALNCAAFSPDGGRIVTIGSDMSKRALPGTAAYAASKFAVVGLTQAAALDLAPHRVNVNAVCPGPVRTHMTEPVIAADPSWAEGLLAHLLHCRLDVLASELRPLLGARWPYAFWEAWGTTLATHSRDADVVRMLLRHLDGLEEVNPGSEEERQARLRESAVGFVDSITRQRKAEASRRRSP